MTTLSTNINNNVLNNNNNLTKKRIKLNLLSITVGDPIGAQHSSWSFLGLAQVSFLEIYKPIDSRLMWQDSYLSQWEGAKERDVLTALEERYEWSSEQND